MNMHADEQRLKFFTTCHSHAVIATYIAYSMFSTATIKLHTAAELKRSVRARECVIQRLDKARDEMLSETKRRSDVDRFYRLELDNNSQLHTSIKVARHDLTNEKRRLDDVDQQCNNLLSEVQSSTSPRSQRYGPTHHHAQQPPLRGTVQHITTLNNLLSKVHHDQQPPLRGTVQHITTLNNLLSKVHHAQLPRHQCTCTQCIRCGLLLQLSHVAWSVCLSVCWSHISSRKNFMHFLARISNTNGKCSQASH